MKQTNLPTFVYFASNSRDSIPLHLVEAGQIETVCGHDANNLYLHSVTAEIVLSSKDITRTRPFGQNLHWCARCSSKSDYEIAAEVLMAAEEASRGSRAKLRIENDLKQQDLLQQHCMWNDVEDAINKQIGQCIDDAIGDEEQIVMPVTDVKSALYEVGMFFKFDRMREK